MLISPATGGGAFKYADILKEKLGVSLDPLDELESSVAGANFLLQEVPSESFTYMDGKKTPIDITCENLFPYLFVIIGTGVGMLKVSGNRKFEPLTGSQISGATVFGLAKLLTSCTSYDKFLELSQLGGNLVLDLIARDVYGGLNCEAQSVSASTLASRYRKLKTSKIENSAYTAEDLAASLLSVFAYNIAQPLS